MKKYIILFVLVLTNAISFFIGSHDFDWYHEDDSRIPKVYITNLKHKMKIEQLYCNAWMELCHYYMYDTSDMWETQVVGTPFYKELENINEGDWEDWYCKWY